MYFSNTLYSFYDHNGPLIFFGGMAFINLLLALKTGKRYFMWMFVGFFILTFNFEYDKHLFSKIKTDMLDLMFPENVRYTKYNLIRTFLDVILPILLDLLGWGIVAINTVAYAKEKRDSTNKLF